MSKDTGLLETVSRVAGLTGKQSRIVAAIVQDSDWLREVKAQAWEEGFEGGRGFDVRNPYEKGADRG